MRVGLVLVGAGLLLVACGNNQPTPALPHAKLVVSNQVWHIGGKLTLAGQGFDVQKETKVTLVQGKNTYQLGTAPVKADGSFEVQFSIPTLSTLQVGWANVEVCSYDKGGTTAIGCTTHLLSLSK